MRIQLNLATNALQSHRRLLVGAGLMAFVGSLVFLLLGWHVYSVRKADAEFRAQTQEISQKLEAAFAERNQLEQFFNAPENAKLHDRAAFLNSIIDARSFDWTLMFMDLERVLPGGVRVISIEPVQVKGRIQVHLKIGSSNEESKLKFIRALETSKEFSGVQLASVKGAQNGETVDRETLELTVVYSRI
jgi:type IV pilus assembly protein PilN